MQAFLVEGHIGTIWGFPCFAMGRGSFNMTKTMYLSAVVMLWMVGFILADPPAPPAPTPPVPVPAPPLKLPEKVTGPRDTILDIVGEVAAGKKITWRVPAGVDSRPKAGADGFTPPSDTGKLCVCAPPGIYRVEGFVVNGDGVSAASTVLVVVGQPDPPPAPADPFTTDLRRLVVGQSKADAAKLKALYSQACGYCNEPTITSLSSLVAIIHTAGDTLQIGAGLQPFRDRLKKELIDKLGGADTALTPALRAQACAIYTTAATALDGADK
jgi:hypothetical protein